MTKSSHFCDVGQSSPQRDRGFVFLAALALVAGAACSSGGEINPQGGGQSGNKGGNAGNQGGNKGGAGGGGGGWTLPPTPEAGPDLPGGGNCGDGVRQRNETCDDGDTEGGDGCSPACQVEANWDCPTDGEDCINLAVCGNGILTSDETCDDGNQDSNDGCSSDCKTLEDGYACPVPGRKCIPDCGDKKKIGEEKCDDGNAEDGDGCTSTCQVEPGYDCPTLGEPCIASVCGNGKQEVGEKCDCGTDPDKLPDGCQAVNGLFYGDGKGCSKTCTAEPRCLDSNGKTQACSSSCGDGNIDPDEECDDGDPDSGDGCSKDCKLEEGFTCDTKTQQDSTTCSDGSGQCLALPMIYRDFQAENVKDGGHPDFPFYGTKFGGSKPTTICVPNSGGPAKGNDSTTRCWGIMAENLKNGKPQPGSTTTCTCQFSDWNIANSGRIPGNYTLAGNDSPLSDASGGVQGGTAGTTVNTTSTGGPYTGTLTGYTSSDPGGPIWKGTAPAYKNAETFNQWFNDDPEVNERFVSVLELPSIGSNIYQFASKQTLATGGFFPLDELNPSQKTLCNLWPYWNHGNGNPFWTANSCTGDQYLFTPRVTASDCASGDSLEDGCWVTSVRGETHNNYFTDEARYYFVYDGDNGISLSFFGDDDLFIFINGVLVLDLGGVHQQLPGKVTVSGSPGDAKVLEGGCLDTGGNQVGASAGSDACSPENSDPPPAASPADFRDRTVKLGLQTGKVYEIAIFGADRHPPESNYQLTLQGFTTKKSECVPRCGDGKVTAGEQCDCGDSDENKPDECESINEDGLYGGCTTKCKYGPFCGDGEVQTEKGGNEQCDKGKENGADLGRDGCTIGCMSPHFCGDGFIDTNLGEDCDKGDQNGMTLDNSGEPADPPAGFVHCKPDCSIPDGVVF